MAESSDRFILVGRILGAHGLKGEVKLESFMQAPEAIDRQGALRDASGATISLKLGRRLGDRIFVARIQGSADREAAEALARRDLYLRRSDLPPAAQDEFYHSDLIGLVARDEAGSLVGTVIGVADYGAGAVLELRGPEGEVLLPFTERVVRDVDLAAGTILIARPKEVSGEPPEPCSPESSRAGT